MLTLQNISYTHPNKDLLFSDINLTVNNHEKTALIEEIIVVALVVLLFLFHVRSAVVAIVTIPLSVLIGFMLVKWFGISLNIMSLGGIALAIGDLVDAGIVMTENAYKGLVKAVLKTDE